MNNYKKFILFTLALGLSTGFFFGYMTGKNSNDRIYYERNAKDSEDYYSIVKTQFDI